ARGAGFAGAGGATGAAADRLAAAEDRRLANRAARSRHSRARTRTIRTKAASAIRARSSCVMKGVIVNLAQRGSCSGGQWSVVSFQLSVDSPVRAWSVVACGRRSLTTED